MLFASNLKKGRIAKNLSQEELAAFLGLSRQTICAYETGRREPNFKILLLIADYFKVSTDYLLGRKEYAIKNNSDQIRKKIIELVGETPLKEFVKEVGKRTGILLPVDKMELYMGGKAIPDSVTLKILALYAQVNVEYFYNDVE